MWAKLRRWWWVAGVALMAWLVWPEMRGWGVGTWVGFALAVAFVIVVYSALYVSGTISQIEDAREWEREQARERARRLVELGVCGDEEDAA